MNRYRVEEIGCGHGKRGCAHCYTDIIEGASGTRGSERHARFFYNECENCGDGCGARVLKE